MKHKMLVSNLLAVLITALAMIGLFKVSSSDGQHGVAYPIVAGCVDHVDHWFRNSGSYEYDIYSVEDKVLGLPFVDGVIVIKNDDPRTFQISNDFVKARESCFPNTLLELDLDQAAYYPVMQHIDRIRRENGDVLIVPHIEGETLTFSYKKKKAE